MDPIHNRVFVLCALMLLTISLLAGCIGGGDDGDASFNGSLASLLLTDNELPEEFREDVERESMTEDDIDDNDFGISEGEMLSAMYYDENFNFGVIYQMVVRVDADKREDALNDFKDSEMVEYGDALQSVNFGKIGDKTVGFKLSEAGMDAYELAFIKKDIMVLFLVSVDEGGESLIKSLAQKVESKI